MAIDSDWHNRLSWLAELMVQNPNKKVRDLQWEALKYYPLDSKACIRGWMTMRIAFLAADLTLHNLSEISSIQPSHVNELGVTIYGL